MTALTTAKTMLDSQNTDTIANPLSSTANSVRSALDSETRAFLSVLGRTLFLLGLGTIGVVAITGQPPLFFVPLAVFLFFVSCLQWRQPSPARAYAEGDTTDAVTTSSVRRESRAVYEGKA